MINNLKDANVSKLDANNWILLEIKFNSVPDDMKTVFCSIY